MITVKLAKIISYLFIPPFMNLAIFTIYSFHFESYPNVFISVFVSLLLGVVFPVYTFVRMRKNGMIANNDATNKEERNTPYIYGIFFTLSGIVITSLLNLNVHIVMLWMVYLVNSILLININHFWKISAHAMGAAIPLGASIFFGEIYLYVFILILASIAFARYRLKVHTIPQIIAGASVGIITTYLLLKYLI